MDAVVVKIEARRGRIVRATRVGGGKWDAAGDLEIGKDGLWPSLMTERFMSAESRCRRIFRAPGSVNLDPAHRRMALSPA